MRKTVTFGELLLRLTPPRNQRLFYSRQFWADFFGPEANVAVSLSGLGYESYFVTRLPQQALGDAALAALRAEGVFVDFIQRGGERLGILFEESGAAPRPQVDVFDRSRSAFGEIEPDSLDWPNILGGAEWLHCSAITAGLGPWTHESTAMGLQAARKAGLITSLALDYDGALWTPQDALAALRPLMGSVDVLIAPDADFTAIGLELPSFTGPKVADDAPSLERVMAQVARDFDLEFVAVTLRQEAPEGTRVGAAILERAAGRLHRSRIHSLTTIDSHGGTEAFTSALIYSLLEGRSAANAVEFASAALALNLTVIGDWNRFRPEEIEHLLSTQQPVAAVAAASI